MPFGQTPVYILRSRTNCCGCESDSQRPLNGFSSHSWPRWLLAKAGELEVLPAQGQRSLIQTPLFLKVGPSQTPLQGPPAAIHLAAVEAFLEGLVVAAELGPGCAFSAGRHLRPEAEGARGLSPGFQRGFYTQFVGGNLRSPANIIDCLGKHRSAVRTEHRLEAYATLRRRVVTPGARR